MTIDNKELAGLTKKERKELQREIARIQRDADRKRRRRRKVLSRTGITVLILAIIAAVGLAAFNTLRDINRGPANMLSDGIVFTGDGQALSPVATAPLEWLAAPAKTPAPKTEGVVRVTVYVDYGNKGSGVFDAANAASIQQWVTAGYVQLEVRPVALERYNTASSGYSKRASSAAACVASLAPTNFLAVHSALLASQPEISGKYLDNTEITELVTKALGTENPDVTSCIKDATYGDWVSAATTRALTGPLPDSTVKKLVTAPLILVNGKPYAGDRADASAFIGFISEVLAAEEKAKADAEAKKKSTATPTPTPTATPTPAK